MANTSSGDDNQSQDKDQGLTVVWREIKEWRTSTRNLEQQLTEVIGQLCELLRGGVQGNMNDLLNQSEGGSLSKPIVDPIPQIRRRLIVDDDSDDEINFGVDPINPGMGRFERNRDFNNNRHDDEFKLKVDIPTFSGDIDIEGFLNWITEVDWFFEYM